MLRIPVRLPAFSPASVVLVAGLSATVLLAACQTSGPKPLSIEQARKVTAEFEDAAFVPPPRTIEDVLAFLKRPNPEAEARRTEWLKLANSEPSPGLGPGGLIEFYKRRAAARGWLGRVQEQIKDMELVIALASDKPEVLSEAHQTLGITFVHVGNFRRGLDHRRQAIALLDPRREGSIASRNANLAAFLGLVGDFAQAERSLSIAKNIETRMSGWRNQTWVPTFRSFIRNASGTIALAKGDNTGAERSFRDSLRFLDGEIERGKDASDGAIGWTLREVNFFGKASVHKVLSVSLRRQGRLIEAEIAARDAIETATGYFGRLSIITAEVMPELATVLLEQGRALDAAKVAGDAVAIYEEMSVPADNLFYNNARVGLAEALATMGRWSEVIELYRAIQRDLSGDRPLFEHIFAGNASWAMAEINAGDPGATVARLTRVLARHSESLGDKHLVTAETRGLLAAALTAQGNARQALPLFDQAFAILTSNSRDSAEEGVTETARNRRIAFILEEYLEALAASGTSDPAVVDKSLRVAGLAQGRSVQQAVLAASARATVDDPVLADLVRREQDARKQIAALNGALANIMAAPPERRAADGEEQLRVRIADLRNARASLAREIETRFPEYAALTNPRPPGVAETQAALAPGEVLIATYLGERASYVWAVPKTGQARFRPVEQNRLQVLASVGRLRRALDPNAATLGEIPEFDVVRAHELYRSFLAPVRASWGDAENLMVVADGPLGQLPLGVLVTEQIRAPSDRRLLFEGYKDVPWLARDHAITVLPSVASLTALRAVPSQRDTGRPFVGFGDPVFQLASAAPATSVAGSTAGSKVATRSRPVKLRNAVRMRGVSSASLAMLPPLPDTADEIKSIALTLNADLTRDVFLGRAATEGQVKSFDFSGYKVVAFATHGLMPGDLDGLAQPALAMSAPQAGDRGDGLLTMEEILSLRLDADWVILSACNTGTAQGAGAEAVSGLGRAFFYAGARALLVSNWPVETTSAKLLTTDIFRRQSAQPGLSRAAALRESVLSLIDGLGYVDEASNTAIFSYAHPIFWAPFSLIGDGGA